MASVWRSCFQSAPEHTVCSACPYPLPPLPRAAGERRGWAAAIFFYLLFVSLSTSPPTPTNSAAGESGVGTQTLFVNWGEGWGGVGWRGRERANLRKLWRCRQGLWVDPVVVSSYCSENMQNSGTSYSDMVVSSERSWHPWSQWEVATSLFGCMAHVQLAVLTVHVPHSLNGYGSTLCHDPGSTHV